MRIELIHSAHETDSLPLTYTVIRGAGLEPTTLAPKASVLPN